MKMKAHDHLELRNQVDGVEQNYYSSYSCQGIVVELQRRIAINHIMVEAFDSLMDTKKEAINNCSLAFHQHHHQGAYSCKEEVAYWVVAYWEVAVELDYTMELQQGFKHFLLFLLTMGSIKS